MRASSAVRALSLLAVATQLLCETAVQCGGDGGTPAGTPAATADEVAGSGSDSDSFLVFLRANAGPPGVAAARLAEEVQAAGAVAAHAAAAAAGAGAGAGAPPFTLIKTIGAGAEDEDSQPSEAGAATAAAGGARGGVRALVLQAAPGVAQLLRASSLVRAVVPDARAVSNAGTVDDNAASAAAGTAVARLKRLPATLVAAAFAGRPRLPRVALLPGEHVPPALARIESSLGGKVGVLEGGERSVGSDVVIAIADTGIECAHPDLRCAAGGKSWVPGTAAFPNDHNPAVDNNGHGTHVAGIVGARNNGRGVVGVAPGVRLLPLKVVDGQQNGSLSSMVDAMVWLLDGKTKQSGVRSRVRVVNWSILYRMDPTSSNYVSSLAVVCEVFRQLSSAGVLTVAAAGNYAGSIAGWVPAACPSVLAVTALSMERNAASSYSNWMPAGASTADRARIMAAPGTTNSTVPHRVVPAGYARLTGTSMAAPMVAGIAATCIAAGGVRPGARGSQVMAAVQAAARERLSYQAYPYDYSGGPQHVISNSSRWYGALLWAGKF